MHNAAAPRQRRDRPRVLTGVFFLMCSVVLFGAFASRNNLLYWFVGMAIGAVLVHGLTAGPPMMKILLGGIRLPESIARNERGSVRVVLVSTNTRRIARALRIELVLRSAGGRQIVARGGMAAIGPGETVSVPLALEPRQRGIYEVVSLRVATTFPFGLSRKELRFDVEGELVCPPNESELAPAEQRSLRADMTRRGADTQPAEIREYVRGDPRRLIAWRASARAQRLLVRDLESERGKNLWLRLHGTTAEYRSREPAAERALDRAMAFGRIAAEMRYRVGVVHEDSGTRALLPGTAGWVTTLAGIGDRTGLVVGPKVGREDIVIDLHPEPEPTARDEAERGEVHG